MSLKTRREHVVEPGPPVGGRRALVEDVRLRALARSQAAREDVVLRRQNVEDALLHVAPVRPGADVPPARVRARPPCGRTIEVARTSWKSSKRREGDVLPRRDTRPGRRGRTRGPRRGRRSGPRSRRRRRPRVSPARHGAAGRGACSADRSVADLAAALGPDDRAPRGCEARLVASDREVLQPGVGRAPSSITTRKPDESTTRRRPSGSCPVDELGEARAELGPLRRRAAGPRPGWPAQPRTPPPSPARW